MAWYELNKEYVAAELCENKDKPELNCCGKCYLNKQLKKVDNPKEDGKQLPEKNRKIELAEFIPVIIDVEISHSISPQKNDVHDTYQDFIGYHPYTSIFHPPAAC